MLELVYPYLLLLLPLPWLIRFLPEYKQQTNMVTVPFFKYLLLTVTITAVVLAIYGAIKAS